MLPKSLDTLRIDINSGKVRKAISVCQSDNVQRTLNFQLVNSGTAVDIDNVLFAEILIHKADNGEADNGCVIDGNSIQYTLRTTDIQALGTNLAQLQLTFKDGQVLTTPTFEINVYSKVLDQNIQRSFNEYTALTEQLVLVTELKTQTDTAKSTAVEAASEATSQAGIATSQASIATDNASLAGDYAASASYYASEAASETATGAQYLNSTSEFMTSASEYASTAGSEADRASTYMTSTSEYLSSTSMLASTAAEQTSTGADYLASTSEYASTAASEASVAASEAASASEAESNALDYAERAEAAYEAMGEGQLVLGETSSTAYRGDRGKTAYDHSQTTGNPHSTTASDVGADPAGSAATALSQAQTYADTEIKNSVEKTIATVENSTTATQAYAEGDFVVVGGQLYKATDTISIGDTLTSGTNIEASTVASEIAVLNADIGTKAAAIDLTTHITATVPHITAAERTLWNGITSLESRVSTIEGKLGYPINPS